MPWDFHIMLFPQEFKNSLAKAFKLLFPELNIIMFSDRRLLDGHMWNYFVYHPSASLSGNTSWPFCFLFYFVFILAFLCCNVLLKAAPLNLSMNLNHARSSYETSFLCWYGETPQGSIHFGATSSKSFYTQQICVELRWCVVDVYGKIYWSHSNRIFKLFPNLERALKGEYRCLSVCPQYITKVARRCTLTRQNSIMEQIRPPSPSLS